MEPDYDRVRLVRVVVCGDVVRVAAVFSTAFQAKAVVREVRGPLRFAAAGAGSRNRLVKGDLGQAGREVGEARDEQERVREFHACRSGWERRGKGSWCVMIFWLSLSCLGILEVIVEEGHAVGLSLAGRWNYPWLLKRGRSYHMGGSRSARYGSQSEAKFPMGLCWKFRRDPLGAGRSRCTADDSANNVIACQRSYT